MKKSILNLNIIVLLYFISNTKEDFCSDGEINISPLGKCRNMQDFLDGKDLSIKEENLFYLASYNNGKFEKNGYKLDIYKLNDTKLQSHNMRKSKLYIPNSCIEQMNKNSKVFLDKNKGIVIIIQDFNNLNDNNIADEYFIFLYKFEDTIKYINSKYYDFSFCNEDPILYDNEIEIDEIKYTNDSDKKLDIKKLLYGRKLKIDLFNPYSAFLNDICFKFTSETGTDVPLESRVEDYYQNITFCDDKDNSHYISYNYSDSKKTITYRCAFGFYKNSEDKSSYLDIIDTELKSFGTVSNIKVITCFRQFLNLRDLIKNYGGIVCFGVLIAQIVCFLIFCYLGVNSIQKKVNNLFQLGRTIINRLSKLGVHLEDDKDMHPDKLNEQIIPKNKFNLWGQVKILKKRNVLKTKSSNINVLNINHVNPPKKTIISLTKEIKKEKEDNDIEIYNIKNENKNKDKKSEIILDDIDKKINNNNSERIKLSQFKEPNLNLDKEENKDDKDDKDKKTENSQIYEYDDDELDEMPLEKAIKYDKRNLFQYYWNILFSNHIILYVFFLHNDYNLFTIKLSLLLMSFPINIAMNIFFYTNENIKLTYIKSLDDISAFWSNISNSVYSSILADVTLNMLRFLSLTHDSVRDLRKISDIQSAESKSKCILKCIKIRIVLYYILSFIFLLVFGFYVLSFCAIFENTQIELIKSMFSSWLISLLYPFLICFISSVIRILSLKCKSKFLYMVEKIIQFF